MIKIRTAKGLEFEIEWAGVSEIDGSFRFAVTGAGLGSLFPVFADPENTKVLTRVFDENEKDFAGFTVLKGIEAFPGYTVVRLMKGA